jgi:signal transduction histidine kinase
LVGDTVRLQIQLENSLFLASQDDLRLLNQANSLRSLVDRLKEQWPLLKIHLSKEASIKGDERAVRTIFSNLVQNAIVHGQATEMNIVVAEEPENGQWVIDIKDNGVGFSGSAQTLGQLFHRPSSTSGSGLGIYICRILAEKMRGQLKILEPTPSGFAVRLVLPKGER